jgi:hypothetical protein
VRFNHALDKVDNLIEPDSPGVEGFHCLLVGSVVNSWVS